MRINLCVILLDEPNSMFCKSSMKPNFWIVISMGTKMFQRSYLSVFVKPVCGGHRFVSPAASMDEASANLIRLSVNRYGRRKYGCRKVTIIWYVSSKLAMTSEGYVNLSVQSFSSS